MFGKQEYSVDLALWAHHHSYQRTCPVYQKKCTPNALTHVVIGMGGQTLEVDRKYVKYENNCVKAVFPLDTFYSSHLAKGVCLFVAKDRISEPRNHPNINN